MAGVFCVALAAVIVPVMADQKSLSKTQRDAFQVVGIEARTTNAREMSGDGVIPKAWGRLMGDKLIEKIPNRAGSEVVALYTDYATDKDGAYTYVLGVPVSSIENVPVGMVAREVPAGRYAVLSAGANPARDAVVHLWQQVWALETARQISRAYRTDYEVHHLSAQGETAAELYIAIKE